MILKTKFLYKIALFAVVSAIIAGGLSLPDFTEDTKNDGIFYFMSGDGPLTKIKALNRHALKGNSKSNSLVWIKEKPESFENRFLFNISCFKMSIILAVFWAMVKSICSKSSYIKRLYHIRI